MKNKLILSLASVQYNRNSRSGNARRTVSQPDHDILEGLPIRRWQKKPVILNTAAVEKPDTNSVTIPNDGFHELEMPKDSNLLPEITYAILRAARMGAILKEGINGREDDTENAADQLTQSEEKSGVLTRKWMLIGRDSEPKEPEYLAKRRKGLRSLYGGSTAPINSTSQMRKIKIRNVDNEGNSQIVEALVPEGQVVDAEILEEELTSPTQALAPGTMVEGVGIANAEGVLVPQEQATPAGQRRRPPPPKRRLKGPGRGKKKKVAFASGTDGSTVPSGLQPDVGKATDPEAVNGVHSLNVDNDGEDSIMHDAGQDGEEGSEEASEGDEAEEGDRDEGEISATPEAPAAVTKAQTVASQEHPIESSIVTAPPVHLAVTSDESDLADDKTLGQETAALKEEPDPQSMDTSYESPSDRSPKIEKKEFPEKSGSKKTTASSVQNIKADATPESFPDPMTETMDEVPPSTSTASSPPAMAKSNKDADISRAHVPPNQDSSGAGQGQLQPSLVTSLPPKPASLPPKPPASSLPPKPIFTTENPAPVEQANRSEQTHVDTTQSPNLIPASDAVPIDLPRPKAGIPHPTSPTPRSLPEIVAVSAVDPKPAGDDTQLSDVTNPVPGADPAASSSSALPSDKPEPSQSLPIEPWVNPIEQQHHTPNAPTPSPPTPIATSFDIHQRERLMESPKAPTMSPPTPLRRDSSSPDLPLAGGGGGYYAPPQPPPLELASASEPRRIPGLNQEEHFLPSLTREEERIDVEAAPDAPETFAAEIPHEHNPLDGLAAPKISSSPPAGEPSHAGEEDVREGVEEERRNKEAARSPDGAEDLLGSLERSLGK